MVKIGKVYHGNENGKQNKMRLSMSSYHIYTDETGTVWPNVTSILSDVGVVDKKWFTERSCIRGKMVHLATALYDQGNLDASSVDPVIEPYLTGWIKFRRESGFVPDMVEKLVYNETCHYAGTLDRTGMKNGVKELIDIKSGTVQPWTALQTSAYDGCLDDNYKRYAVELHNNGTYKLIPYIDRNDWHVWLGCLALRNWKLNNKIK